MASRRFPLAYGRFRTVDLGDLTWNGELDLMCPTNRIGTVDLYLTSITGSRNPISRARACTAAAGCKMNSGTRKGGEPDVFRVLYESPGLEDLWQLHWAYNAGLENSPATFVANMEDNATIAGVVPPQRPPRGGGASAERHTPRLLDQSLRSTGRTFTVTNTRNNFTRLTSLVQPFLSGGEMKIDRGRSQITGEPRNAGFPSWPTSARPRDCPSIGSRRFGSTIRQTTRQTVHRPSPKAT